MTVPEPVMTPTRARGILHRVMRSPGAMVGAALVALLVLLALFGPLFAPFDAGWTELRLVSAPPFQTEFLLGGDRAGRDIFSRLLWASPNSMGGAAIAVLVAMLVGVPSGLVVGFSGRITDAIGNWVASVVLAIPGMIVLIAFYTVIGPNMVASMIVVGVLLGPGFFRLVRNLVLEVREELYIDAAKVSGLSTARIIGRHVLGAIRGPLIVHIAFTAGLAIVIQSGLEFLGLGSPTSPTWGGMLQDAFANIYTAPIALLWPALLITLAVLGLVLLGNGIRDSLAPRSPRPRGTRRAAPTAPVVSSAPEGAVLTIDSLTIAYPTPTGERVVVEDVSLWVREGEVLGLVGESGSGKSQTAFAALGLLPDDAIIRSGAVTVTGTPTGGLSEPERNAIRGTEIAYVPQDPMSNLDPAFTVAQQFEFAMRRKLRLSRAATRARALALLERVHIADPVRVMASYPHQLSGGMAQRVLIALAVCCEPRVLIADEPTTALDVTVQAEVLDLLRELQQERSMALLLVTHNFGVVADLCDRVAVMRAGRIVESGTTEEILSKPSHEYTKLLLASVLDNAPLRGPLVAPSEQGEA